MGYNLKQQFRLVSVKADVAQLVQDKQVCTGKAPFQFDKFQLVFRLAKLGGKRGCVLKQDFVTQSTGSQPESNGEMRLSSARIANHNDVFLVLDELAGAKLPHEIGAYGLVQLREVKLGQRLFIREACAFQAALVLVFQPSFALCLHEFEQHPGEPEVGVRLPKHLLIFRKCRNLHLLGIQANLFINDINAHALTPFAKPQRAS